MMKLFLLCLLYIQAFSSSPVTVTQLRTDDYVTITEADTSAGILILVNKTRKLPEGYRPADLVPIEKAYNRAAMNLLRKEAASAFSHMCSRAAKDSITLWNRSAYRSDTVQRELFENAVLRSGLSSAENFSARPGHSEHQTGLTVDINSVHHSFSNTPESAWLKEHAHRYGFIERYPSGKEHITGYRYEPWHYRYVGKKAATYIYQHKITLEEYYEITGKQTRKTSR
ncbi:MAG TPA: M15 family metallopeptidase [Bacteroidales bacterium]|nr:M15 family metallopeptidase [Bacteroidales bacterium]HRW94363.1 M15 family metallopeptidase [Bacteroidales bacterium]